MSQSDRKKLLVELEAELRRTSTALAIAQADYEKAYTGLYEYMSEHTDGPQRMLVFSDGITVH